MCVGIYICAFFCSECYMHFTGVLVTSAWAGVYVTQVCFYTNIHICEHTRCRLYTYVYMYEGDLWSKSDTFWNVQKSLCYSAKWHPPSLLHWQNTMSNTSNGPWWYWFYYTCLFWDLYKQIRRFSQKSARKRDKEGEREIETWTKREIDRESEMGMKERKRKNLTDTAGYRQRVCMTLEE